MSNLADSPVQLPTTPYWLADITRAGYIPLLEELVAGSQEELPAALELVVKTIEAQCEGVVASILLLDQDTQQLRHGAGPNLPKSYREAIDGIVIGPMVGSCGAAAYLATRVIVTDIASDPKWAPYRNLAEAAGLGACWSQPIVRADGMVLGTFAMYYAEPREPTEAALLVIDAAAHLARMAIERDRARRTVAERRVLEIKLLQAQKLESLGVLAGGVAHDFNNLLVSVLGNAGLARSEAAPGSSSDRFLGEIETAAERAADLANQLLAYSGKGRFQVKLFDLCALVREMTQLLGVSIPKSATLELDLCDELACLEADVTQVRQLVMNLIVNASEALGEEPGVVRVRVRKVGQDAAAELPSAADLSPGPLVLLEVSDTGCGMDATTLEKIFDPFFTTKFTGRGLGMASVQGVVRGHGGVICVDSEPGKGTTFRILFPAATATAPLESVSPKGSNTVVAGKTILVVDDDAQVRTVAKHALEAHGYVVILAANGRVAVELFKQRPATISCVLLDMTMPHMGGVETLQELRKIKPDVAVVLSSGFFEEPTPTGLVEGRAPHFIQKPYRIADLAAKLAAAMATATPPGEDGEPNGYSRR